MSNNSFTPLDRKKKTYLTGFTLVSAVIIVAVISASVWAILSLSSILTRQKKITSTEDEMREISDALLSFYHDLDVFPYDSGNAAVDLKDLEEKPATSRFVQTSNNNLNLQVWRRNHWDGPYIVDYYQDDGYTRDEWNTTYKYDYSKISGSDLWSDICVLTSAGPDRIFGDGDDITINVSATKIRREKIEKIKKELTVVNAAANELLTRITNAGKTINDVFGRDYLEIGDLYSTYGADTTGLVAWWKMDEASWNGTSGEVVDSQGSNNGTAKPMGSGPTTVSYGKLVRAGKFDGVNDYVDLPDSLGYTTQVSAFAWFKSKGTPPGSYHIVMGGVQLEISVHSSGYLRTGVYTSDGRFVSNYGSGLTDGNWHYIGFTFDGSTKNSYIDGAYVGNLPVTGTLTFSFSNRRIGRFGSSTAYYMNGLIDEVRIWNRALPSSDVLQEYLRGEYLTDWAYRYDEWENEYKWDSTDNEFYSYGPNRVDNDRADSDDDDIYQTKAYCIRQKHIGQEIQYHRPLVHLVSVHWFYLKYDKLWICQT
jgi:hypothetical protein